MSTQAMAVRVGSSGTEATSRSLFLLARVDGLLPGDRGAALASAAPPCGWAIIAFGDLPSFQLRAPPTASRPVTVDLGLTNRRGTAAHTAAKPPIPIPTAERLRPTLTVRPGDLEGLEPTPETTKSHPITDRVGFRQLPLSEPKDSHCGGPEGNQIEPHAHAVRPQARHVGSRDPVCGYPPYASGLMQPDAAPAPSPGAGAPPTPTEPAVVATRRDALPLAGRATLPASEQTHHYVCSSYSAGR